MQHNPDTSERRAQLAVDRLAVLAAAKGAKVTRFTPSIKMGRRYLGLEHKGYSYAITVEVSKTNPRRRARRVR
jgi:hypothetical protein